MSVYTSALTAQDTSAQTLTVNEQYALITDVQNVPTTVEILEDGSEYVTYGVTPASEAAGAKLLAAFWPAITRAARSSKLKGREEDAQSVALEAFVRAVREYDLTSDTPFHHTLPGRLRHAVLEDDRTVNPAGLSIPAVAVARYHRLMHAHGEDAAAAYLALDGTEGNLMSKASFLTVHHALTGGMSLDWTTSFRAFEGAADEGSADPADPNRQLLVSALGASAVVGPEDEYVNREYARWLLAQTTDRQESVCRLAYGFTDAASDAARLDHGYREGDVLDDSQVADCLGLTRPTVQRERSKALKTMRAAADSAAADEIA